MSPNIRSIRAVLLIAVVLLALPVAVDYGTVRGETHVSATTTTSEVAGVTTPDNRTNGSGTTTSPDTTSQSATTNDTSMGGLITYTVDAHGPEQITVFNRRTDEVLFTRDDYDVYHDVDPSPAGTETLMYAASEIRGDDRCPESFTGGCVRNVIERVNYSTGEIERLYRRTVAWNGSSAPHDVDRLAEDRYLVADIQFDRIFILDTANDTIVWSWDADSAYDRSSGGREGDWTHLNDVEVIEEDLYMVSLRNQDQVVFVHRERGLIENRTLGADDDYDILYEAHNPDYIPRERGGPAIIIADSENDRVVEYQWENGSWHRSWLWGDETLTWPRDADRLPNGNTLITDTHGLRLLEVAPSGEVVWRKQIGGGIYEAELLGTGTESAGGYSMAAIRAGILNETGTTTARTDTDSSVDNSTVDANAGVDVNSSVNVTQGVDATSGVNTDGPVAAAKHVFLNSLPPLVFHGFLFVLPPWVTPLSGGLLLVDVVLVGLWGVGESVRFVLLRRHTGSSPADAAD